MSSKPNKYIKLYSNGFPTLILKNTQYNTPDSSIPVVAANSSNAYMDKNNVMILLNNDNNTPFILLHDEQQPIEVTKTIDNDNK